MCLKSSRERARVSHRCTNMFFPLHSRTNASVIIRSNFRHADPVSCDVFLRQLQLASAQTQDLSRGARPKAPQPSLRQQGLVESRVIPGGSLMVQDWPKGLFGVSNSPDGVSPLGVV